MGRLLQAVVTQDHESLKTHLSEARSQVSNGMARNKMIFAQTRMYYHTGATFSSPLYHLLSLLQHHFIFFIFY